MIVGVCVVRALGAGDEVGRTHFPDFGATDLHWVACDVFVRLIDRSPDSSAHTRVANFYGLRGPEGTVRQRPAIVAGSSTAAIHHGIASSAHANAMTPMTRISNNGITIHATDFSSSGIMEQSGTQRTARLGSQSSMSGVDDEDVAGCVVDDIGGNCAEQAGNTLHAAIAHHDHRRVESLRFLNQRLRWVCSPERVRGRRHREVPTQILEKLRCAGYPVDVEVLAADLDVERQTVLD